MFAADHHPIIDDRVLARVLALPSVRPLEVARARALLASRAWSRPTEVACTLIDCLVARRVP